MPLYFPESKATFIHIPKNAGNSLENWVKAHSVPFEDKWNHCTLPQARTLWDDLGYTFSFVRNPFSRTVSIFHYLGQRVERRILEKKSINLEDDLRTVHLYKKGFDYWLNCLYDENSNFNEKHEITHINGESQWPRRAPQSFWFDGDHLDMFVKIENLDFEFQKVKDIIGCESQVPIGVVNTSQHGPYRDYYNEQNIKIVREMFKKDLDAWDYDF